MELVVISISNSLDIFNLNISTIEILLVVYLLKANLVLLINVVTLYKHAHSVAMYMGKLVVDSGIRWPTLTNTLQTNCVNKTSSYCAWQVNLANLIAFISTLREKKVTTRFITCMVNFSEIIRILLWICFCFAF